jgi:hypothetical protein
MALYQHWLVMVGEQSASSQVEISNFDRLTSLEDLPEKGSVALNGFAKAPPAKPMSSLRPDLSVKITNWRGAALPPGWSHQA